MKTEEKNRFEQICVVIFRVLCGIVFAALFIFSFVRTGRNSSLDVEYAYFSKDSIIGNLVGIFIALLSAWVVSRFADMIKKQKYIDIIAVIVSIICFVFSIYWIQFVKSVPSNDQMNLVEYAVKFNQGDFSSLQKGGYMAKCTHQLGLVTIFRLIMKIVGEGNYRAIQYFIAATVPVFVFSGYNVVKKISASKGGYGAEMIYLLSVMLYFPMYGYVPFVYGEISSTAFVMLSAWMVLECIYSFNLWKCLVLMLSGALAYQMRMNSVIIYIGMIIVLAVSIISKPRIKTVLTAASLIAGIILSTVFISAMYDRYIPEDSHSMPAVLYIAMGTNHSHIEAPGWFDGYNHNEYERSGFDPEKAKESSYLIIREFMEKCTNDPEYAYHFFSLKMNSQWNVPMCQCLVMTRTFEEEPSQAVRDIYFGEKGNYIEKYLNIFQLIIYGSILYILFFGKGRWKKIETYILLTGIFGGFIFTMIWEAKTRYVFPYMLLAIVPMSTALNDIVHQTFGITAKHNSKTVNLGVDTRN